MRQKLRNGWKKNTKNSKRCKKWITKTSKKTHLKSQLIHAPVDQSNCRHCSNQTARETIVFQFRKTTLWLSRLLLLPKIYWSTSRPTRSKQYSIVSRSRSSLIRSPGKALCPSERLKSIKAINYCSMSTSLVSKSFTTLKKRQSRRQQAQQCSIYHQDQEIID